MTPTTRLAPAGIPPAPTEPGKGRFVSSQEQRPNQTTAPQPADKPWPRIPPPSGHRLRRPQRPASSRDSDKYGAAPAKVSKGARSAQGLPSVPPGPAPQPGPDPRPQRDGARTGPGCAGEAGRGRARRAGGAWSRRRWRGAASTCATRCSCPQTCETRQ